LISIQDILKNTWDIFIKNLVLFTGMFAIIFLLSLLMGLLSPNTSDGESLQFFLFRIASNLFSMGLTLGSIKIVLDVLNGKPTKIETLFNSFQLLIPYVAGYLFFSGGMFLLFLPFSKLIIANENILIIVEAFLSGNINELFELLAYSVNYKYLFLYCLPCFYMWIKIQFFPYFIILNEMGPIDALKKSYEVTEGHSVSLILFIITLMMINLIGIIPFGMGLLFTIPFSFVATGVMFTTLNN